MADGSVSAYEMVSHRKSYTGRKTDTERARGTRVAA